MLRTVDGGVTWKKVATAPQGDLLGLHFASATEGWALANDGAAVAGTVQHTTDGGSDVDGADHRAGHAAVRRRQRGAGRLGGRRRSFGRPGPRRRARQRRRRAAAQRRRRRDVGDAVGRRSRRPASQRRRHAGRAGRAGRSATAAPPSRSLVLRTTDGGDTWAPQDPGDVTFDLAAVHALDAQTAWAVGDGQQILATADGGATWTSTRGDVVGPVTRVQPATARRGSRARMRYVVATAGAAASASPSTSATGAATCSRAGRSAGSAPAPSLHSLHASAVTSRGARTLVRGLRDRSRRQSAEPDDGRQARRALTAASFAPFVTPRCPSSRSPSSSDSCAAGRATRQLRLTPPLAPAVALPGISQLLGSRCKAGAAPQL